MLSTGGAAAACPTHCGLCAFSRIRGIALFIGTATVIIVQAPVGIYLACRLCLCSSSHIVTTGGTG
eukprot:scaffold8518_cov135-Isochrysis_galbana.AAC.5